MIAIVHYFEVDIAEKYGVNAAIIIQHFNLWISKNEANGENFHDGQYWTYNSVKAFKKLFPYMSEKAIRKAIQILIDEGLVVEGNFNKLPYDRTKWYAITEKGKSIFPKGQMDIPEKSNDIFPKGQMTISQKGKPIPSNIPSNNEEEVISVERGLIKEIVEAYNAVAKDYGIPTVTKLMPDTDRYKMLKSRISEYGADSVYKAIENIKTSSFLQGKVAGSHFVLNFEWFVRPNNFPKILDGNYTDKKVAPKQQYNREPPAYTMEQYLKDEEETKRRVEMQRKDLEELLSGKHKFKPRWELEGEDG